VPAGGRELLDAAKFVIYGGQVPGLERRVDQPDVAPQFGYAPSGTSPGRSGPFGAVRLTWDVGGNGRLRATQHGDPA